MPNKFSIGCGCCETGNSFQSQGAATVLWKAPPCTQNNRIGIDVTIENLADCTDDNGIFPGTKCGTCTRTFSNINGTYYVPILFDDLSPNVVEKIFGPWYTAGDSCVGVDGGTCVSPATYSYFKIRFEIECDATNGLQIVSGESVKVYACDIDGNEYSLPIATNVNVPSTWGSSVNPYPDCCKYSSYSGGNICCNGPNPGTTGCTTSTTTGSERYKFEWVTA